MPCQPLSCRCGKRFIPQRYVLAFMGFLGLLHAYNLRVCINLVITEMVPTQNRTAPNQCPDLKDEQVVIKGGKKDWTAKEESYVLNSFFVGYVATHIPAGILADRFGGRHVFGSSIFISVLMTLLTPAAVKYGNLAAVIVVRLIMGLAQGLTFPGVTALLSKWVPKRERSSIGAFVYASVQLGNLTGVLASGYLVAAAGTWHIAFYFWGSMAAIWCFFYLFMVFSQPDTHPFVTPEEAEMLANEIKKKEKMKTPWKKIFSSLPVWALIFGQFGHNWIHFTILVNLPQYMKYVLKYNIKNNAIWVTVPYIALWFCGTMSGIISDKIIKSEKISIGLLRKICTTIASVGPSVCGVIAVHSGCNRVLAISMFTIGMFTMGPFYAGMRVNVLDLTVNFAGTIMSFVNGLGAVAGVFTPFVVGAIAGENYFWQWQVVFWILFAVATVTNILYLFWASGERQPWDMETQETT